MCLCFSSLFTNSSRSWHRPSSAPFGEILGCTNQNSLPRSELCAADLGGKLLTTWKYALEKMDVEIYSILGWTDSTIVLSWLANFSSNWPTFVGNRVSRIQKAIAPEQWGHVDSSNNPAVKSSRILNDKSFNSLTQFSSPKGTAWLMIREQDVSAKKKFRDVSATFSCRNVP